MRSLIPLVFTLTVVFGRLPADTWPQFRGPAASGIAEGSPPTQWNLSAGHNVRFKVPVPGLAHSSPIIWNDRLFVTTAVPVGKAEDAARLEIGWIGGSGEEAEAETEWTWQLLCLDSDDGELIWQRDVHQGVPITKRHIKATHANCTPATDGEYVVVFLGSEGLFCYDFDGNQRWKRDFGKLHVGPYNAPELEWGSASSPVIFEQYVIVQCDALNANFVAVLDLNTGAELQRIPRDDVSTWSTPAVLPGPNGPQIICNGYRQMAAYDLLTGDTRWTLEGGGDVPVPTPIVANGLVYITNGHGRSPVYAIELDAEGVLTPDDESQPEGLKWWVAKGGSYMPTPIVVNNRIYLCSDRGRMVVADASTGEQIYRERVGGENAYSASVVCGGEHLFWVDEGGEVYVIQTGDTYELLSTNSIGEPCLATPAIANNALYVRSVSHLYCFAHDR